MHRKPKRNGMKPKVVREDLGSDDDYAYNDRDSVFNDNASVASQLSDISVPNKDETFLGVGRESPVEDNEELYEEKIKEALDLATQKSANGRVQALEGLCRAFSKKYLPDFVEGRYLTITDVVEKALKKGKGLEKAAGASLASSLCIQLGPSDTSEEVYKALKSTLITALNDNSNSNKARAAIAYALGMTCFLAGGEMAEVVNIMSVMEKIFMSPRKGGDANGDIFELHTAAVSAWSLLLTMLPSDRSYSMLESHMETLGALLKSADVDLRIAVGEAIAILFESAVDHDEDSTFESVESLCDDLRELATDSNKRRSKKDRKEQRSSFRDILKTIEDGRDYHEKISVNSREVLYIDSWSSKKQYDSICKVLLSGVNLHMTENELIRDIFGLGAPLPILSSHNTNKPSKYEKQLVNSQAFKHRTKTRGKERDKRSAIF